MWKPEERKQLESLGIHVVGRKLLKRAG